MFQHTGRKLIPIDTKKNCLNQTMRTTIFSKDSKSGFWQWLRTHSGLNTYLYVPSPLSNSISQIVTTASFLFKAMPLPHPSEHWLLKTPKFTKFLIFSLKLKQSKIQFCYWTLIAQVTITTIHISTVVRMPPEKQRTREFDLAELSQAQFIYLQRFHFPFPTLS